MTLILSNAEIAEVISMKECIDTLEDAYIDLAEGRGVTSLVQPARHDKI